MPSFDIVSQVNQQEVKNAVEQTNKEVSNRFDFKGSDARVEQAEMVLMVYADDEFNAAVHSWTRRAGRRPTAPFLPAGAGPHGWEGNVIVSPRTFALRV